MKKKEARKKSIAVLMGGWSAEREVSLKTGGAILEALEGLGYRCRAVDVGPGVAGEITAFGPDLALIALHGRGGEDGAVQGMLEILGIPYTGSGILASALALNKKYTKWIFDFHSLATAPYRFFSSGGGSKDLELPFPFPVVVKPISEGSTIGVSIVEDAGELERALGEAWKYDKEALVEKYIAGREITVGMIGKRTLPVIEIIAEKGFYDYQAKYESRETRYVVPAVISPTLENKLSTLAVEAVSVLGCRGVVRVDFRVDEEDEPYLLEVNTIPGMTETSLLPKAARVSGLSFGDLIEEMIIEALEENH